MSQELLPHIGVPVCFKERISIASLQRLKLCSMEFPSLDKDNEHVTAWTLPVGRYLRTELAPFTRCLPLSLHTPRVTCVRTQRRSARPVASPELVVGVLRLWHRLTWPSFDESEAPLG
ncbi:uncharacterized protein LOC144103654 [Amblyomma americanum]